MIYVYLTGGLGNQMFQYAAARAFAAKQETSVCLDLSFLNSAQEGVTKRKYELDIFNIKVEFASKSISNYIRRSRSGYMKYLNIFRFLKIRNVVEQGFGYTPIDIIPGENICLFGYWQSEKYFSDIKDLIKSDLTVKIEPEGKNKEMGELINSVDSVSIHIRRDDYVNNLRTNQTHGVCSSDYYVESLNYIEGRVKNPHYFVFSDDIEWCRDNIKSEHPVTYVSHNGADRAYEDLRLMSLCKNNIIANSSFSWWGAWLNSNPEKIVIAPKKWFNDESYPLGDIFIESWILK